MYSCGTKKNEESYEYQTCGNILLNNVNTIYLRDNLYITKKPNIFCFCNSSIPNLHYRNNLYTL